MGCDLGLVGQQAGPVHADLARDHYINWVEPKVERYTDGREVVGEGNVKHARPDPVMAYDRKFAEGNPVAGRMLSKIEATAVKTGQNPRQIRYKNADATQVAKLLTILIEFNPGANDDFTGEMVPQAVFDDATTPEDERAPANKVESRTQTFAADYLADESCCLARRCAGSSMNASKRDIAPYSRLSGPT